MSVWKNLRRLFLNNTPAPQPKRERAVLDVEQLEDRLAMTVDVNFSNGILSVLGDNADNRVVLTMQVGGRLVVAADSQVNFTGNVTPTIHNVVAIAVVAGDGNDEVIVREVGGLLPQVSVHGDGGNDLIRGGAGTDTIVGDDGNDVIFGNAGNDDITGDAGNDKIFGGVGDDILDGGTGADILNADAGDDRVNGGDGNDLLRGAGGSDDMKGGLDDDKLLGQNGDDVLDGEDGRDIINGAAGDDSLLGGAGDDHLVGSAGADTSRGGTGDDVYSFDADNQEGTDSLIEQTGEGSDTLRFATSTAGVTVDLGSSVGQSAAAGVNFTLSAGDTFENGIGGAGNDTFNGNSQVNTYFGGGGQDLYIHSGSADGIDIVEDMTASDGDQVSFVTSGAVLPADLTLDATAKQLRDVATGTFGFDFTTAVFAGTSFYIFGKTDETPNGQLITFNGIGGFSQGSNVDGLMVSYASNGSTIGGAAGDDRLIDFSANGNSLVGRDGEDILIAGDGDDTLQGDRGFSPGVSDTYTGGAGADTFVMGEAFGGGSLETFGAETITDFGDGADQVDLFTGLSVRTGLGTTTVTIWDGATDFGTITATNGHLWQAGDFV